jgi:hypothetical protein
VTGQIARVSGGRKADTVEADSISSSSALRRYIELAHQLLQSSSTGVEGAQIDSKHKTPVTVISISEFESDAERLLSPSSSAVQPSCQQSSPALQFALSPALKAWIALLAAKISLCVYSEHQRAYRWVRRALSFVVPRSSDAPKLGGMGGEGASCLAVDRCLPRLEVGQLPDVNRHVTSASIRRDVLLTASLMCLVALCCYSQCGVMHLDTCYGDLISSFLAPKRHSLLPPRLSGNPLER